MRSYTPFNTGSLKCNRCGMYNSCPHTYYTTNHGGPICQDCYTEVGQMEDLKEEAKKLLKKIEDLENGQDTD